MQNYDILKDTWIYQEIRQQVLEEQELRHINDQQQIVLEIVQTRFPRITRLAKAIIDHTTDLATLRNLLIKIGTARAEKEARQYLAELRQQVSS